MRLPFGAMAKIGIGYLSDAFNMVKPEEITAEQKVQMQNFVATFYSVAKNFGPDLIVKTDNDLDDAVLKELIQICEQAAATYELELNPQNIVVV